MTDMVFLLSNYHKDEAALDIIAALMDKVRNLFYKNFVSLKKLYRHLLIISRIIRRISFTVLSFRLARGYGIYFNNIESVLKYYCDWEADGFSDEDLSMVKKEIETDIIDKESYHQTTISTWEWLGRGKYNISSELDRYNSVTVKMSCEF